MSKAIDCLTAIALSAASAAVAALAWQASGDLAHINAPITPVLWIGGAFFAFCAVAYAGAAFITPFRRA